jgi:hypothetical protein
MFLFILLVGLVLVMIRPWEKEPEYDFSRGSVFPEYL